MFDTLVSIEGRLGRWEYFTLLVYISLSTAELKYEFTNFRQNVVYDILVRSQSFFMAYLDDYI